MNTSFLRKIAARLTPAAFAAVLWTMAGQATSSEQDSAWSRLDPAKLNLRSQAVLVVDGNGRRIAEKNASEAMPIASITKLMTAMVVLDSGADLTETVRITRADRDMERLTGSRLEYGKARLSRGELLTLALMSSENRAAAALGRSTLPGGSEAFVAAMNRKAKSLGMTSARFVDSTGLSAGNVASAEDLVKLMRAAESYPLIRRSTTTRDAEVKPYPKRGTLRYVNTNRLLKNPNWEIVLGKTGYIDEAGRCLVMKASVHDRLLYIVLLNSFGKLTPFGDSNRLRKWIGAELKKG